MKINTIVDSIEWSIEVSYSFNIRKSNRRLFVQLHSPEKGNQDGQYIPLWYLDGDLQVHSRDPPIETYPTLLIKQAKDACQRFLKLSAFQ